jgi:hypothetical protein
MDISCNKNNAGVQDLIKNNDFLNKFTLLFRSFNSDNFLIFDSLS